MMADVHMDHVYHVPTGSNNDTLLCLDPSSLFLNSMSPVETITISDYVPCVTRKLHMYFSSGFHFLLRSVENICA